MIEVDATEKPKGAHCELNRDAAVAFGAWLAGKGHLVRVVTRLEVRDITRVQLIALFRDWSDSPPVFADGI